MQMLPQQMLSYHPQHRPGAKPKAIQLLQCQEAPQKLQRNQKPPWLNQQP